MERQERQKGRSLQPLHLSSDAHSSSDSMAIGGSAVLPDSRTDRATSNAALRGKGQWDLPIVDQSGHEVAFTFRIIVVLASSMFFMFGMVKLFLSSSKRRQKRRKKPILRADTVVTSNDTTKDLEANQEDTEIEKLLNKDETVDDTVPIRTASTRKAPALWLTDIGQNWMSHLDNDRNLASISMPGSHDSGSRYGGIYVTTQTWSIEDQLKSGIRFLDIRCRREGKVFTIHHGPFYQHLWFDQVLEVIRSFLEGHPSETILMRVKEEYDAKDGSESFVAIWNRYMNELGYGDMLAQYPWDGKTIPTLGQVRGKFVLLRDFTWNGPEIGLHYERFGNAIMEVQDDYSIPFVNGIAKKKREVKSFLEKAKKRPSQNSFNGEKSGALRPVKFIINHCSGTKPPVYTPSFVAKRTNRLAYDEIGSSSHSKYYTGIIVMDFPGESLIHRIILSNATKASPTKTILDTQDVQCTAWAIK